MKLTFTTSELNLLLKALDEHKYDSDEQAELIEYLESVKKDHPEMGEGLPSMEQIIHHFENGFFSDGDLIFITPDRREFQLNYDPEAYKFKDTEGSTYTIFEVIPDNPHDEDGYDGPMTTYEFDRYQDVQSWYKATFIDPQITT